MPIELHWANQEQSVLIEKFYDVWTWSEVGEACLTQVAPIVQDSAHPIVLIQDMIGSHWTPTTKLMDEVKRLFQDAPCPKQIEMVVVVSGEVSVNALVTSAYRRFGNPDLVYEPCSTVNQAIQVATQFLKV